MAKVNHNISAPNDGLGDQLRTAFGNQNAMNTELYADKVDKVAGKGLSTNDYSNIDKAKVDAIQAGAEVNVQSDWEQADITADNYIKNKPPEMFSSVGSFHYVDLATQSTPLSALAGVEKKITNDTADPTTNVLNAPYGISSMWDTVNSQLDFTQTAIGDLITIIPAVEITTTIVNQEFQIYAKLGIGSLNPTTKQIYIGSLKAVGTIVINATRDFDISDADIKDFPAELYILTDANASVKSGALDIKVVRKNINIVSSDPSKQNVLTAGTNITIDVTDPLNPVINASAGGASSPIATATVTGTVKTDIMEADPIVYTKTTADGLLLAKEPANANIQAHVISAHAPANAQKNSDITKAEIEAKLIGEITTHTHVKNDVISYALSAPTGNLVVGDVDTFQAPYNFTLVSYWIAVKTPPTISSLLVDVKKSGVSITSTKAGIDAAEYTSLTGTAPILTTTAFLKGDPITPTISQIGSGDTGISLKIYLEVIKT